MARLILEGLTKEQAKALASWFEGQGEQECRTWLEDAMEIAAPTTNVQHRNYKKIDKKTGDVTIQCHTP